MSGLRQASGTLTVSTHGQGLVELTDAVLAWVETQGVRDGLLTLFCRHTSASLLIQENAARAVRADLETFFAVIAPEDPNRYAHDDEGPDDMPAHIRTALTGVQLSIPVARGRPRLGTWQGIYLFEHRRAPHRREVATHLIGD
jgi:secondary thiamine-phosphate synthase enzyme